MRADKKLIVVVGPTGVGKTAMSIRLAEHYNTEVISADSRQFFLELNSGTAKPTSEELSRIPHHFINSISIDEKYDAGKFGVDALVVINKLFEKNNFVVVSGGSGLYIKAICEGFDEMPEMDESLRTQIANEYREKGLPWLQRELEKLDPDYFGLVDSKNPQRMMRALEILRSSGRSIAESRNKKKYNHDFSIIKIGLEMDRDKLYERLDLRFDKMINEGLFEEAQKFFDKRRLNALQTVGYKEIFGFLEGKYSREEAIRLAKRNTRRYAKRQMTWFRGDDKVKWFNHDDESGIVEYIAGITE